MPAPSRHLGGHISQEMHFTFWLSLTSNVGVHAEITWESFVSFVSKPLVVAEKTALEGWSPARFRGNRRGRDHVELVSAIVLDDDKSGLPIDRVREIWRGFRCVIHTTHSHALDSPKYRIVLACSRDMTVQEHSRVWVGMRDHATKHGQTIDESTKDPSRLWFTPAHRPGATYEWLT